MLRGSHLLGLGLAPLGLALGLSACGGGSSAEELPVERDVQLRTLMTRMESERLIIEANLRNADAMDTLLARGRNLARHVQEASFRDYPAHPDMAGKDGDLFLEYRDRLISAVEDFVTAAEAGDLEGIYEPFTLLDASCTTCHKRFDPTY